MGVRTRRIGTPEEWLRFDLRAVGCWAAEFNVSYTWDERDCGLRLPARPQTEADMGNGLPERPAEWLYR
jgi:hypothetical protein